MATAVKTFTGIPNKNHERTAVNINSKALANVFKIELSERRNMAVTIPMAPLLRTISKTLTVKSNNNNDYCITLVYGDKLMRKL